MPRRPTSLPIADEPWFKDGLSFQCTQCGNCCTGGPGYVWMSDDEIERLAAFLKLTVEQATKKYCRSIRGKVSLREKRDHLGQYPCIFLSEEEITDARGRKTLKRGCTIYPVRPLQCRTWPFWDGNLQDADAWSAAGEKCPGLNRGKAYALEQILALRDAQDWPDRAVTPGSGAADPAT